FQSGTRRVPNGGLTFRWPNVFVEGSFSWFVLLVPAEMNTAVLLIDCPDRKGLVAGVAGLLYRYGANITHADQHQDHEAGLFFMRVEWALDGFDLSAFRAE